MSGILRHLWIQRRRRCTQPRLGRACGVAARSGRPHRESMTESEFRALGDAGYNRVPVVLETFADLDTPLSIYLKLANEPYTYLLESVVGGERFGRYSFIGLAAGRRIEVRGFECCEIEHDSVVHRETHQDPLAFVEAYLRRF